MADDHDTKFNLLDDKLKELQEEINSLQMSKEYEGIRNIEFSLALLLDGLSGSKRAK